jgi:hypothetical protein
VQRDTDILTLAYHAFAASMVALSRDASAGASDGRAPGDRVVVWQEGGGRGRGRGRGHGHRGVLELGFLFLAGAGVNMQTCRHADMQICRHVAL